jgi:OTU domain-containing protein 6
MEGESLGKTKIRHKLELKSWEKEKAKLVKAAKKRPEALQEVQQREDALLRRHADELAARANVAQEDDGGDSTHGKEDAKTDKGKDNDKQGDRQQRLAKQREKREKKQEARWEKEDVSAYDAASADSAGEKERAAIVNRLRERRLELVEVPADGWCMFAALGHQLGVGAAELRKQAARHMREHAAEFSFFFEDGSFEGHCAAVAEGPEWGGEAELVALARTSATDIRVISADSEVVIYVVCFGFANPLQVVVPCGGAASREVVLAFHRVLYASGEHYNSVRPLPEQ